jgi:hypothetical protein
MCFVMRRKKLCLLVSITKSIIEEISVILFETFYIWKNLLYSHTMGIKQPDQSLTCCALFPTAVNSVIL